MGQIYLVRHGETAWNKAKIFRGRRDVPLDEQGRLEAAAAAKALREVVFDRIYTSPLVRARATAEAIAAGRPFDVAQGGPERGRTGRGVEPVADDAFTDIDYGEWTEYWDVEARRKFGEQYRQWHESPHLVTFPGGESLDDVRRRAVRRLLAVGRCHADGLIALVSHRVVLKVLLLEAKGLDNSHFWHVQLDTGAISVLECRDGALRLVVENDTRHLRDQAGHGSVDF